MNKRKVYEGAGGIVSTLVTDQRKARIEQVLKQRTNQVIPVFEYPHDLGNVSAVLRTAEGLGFQEAHVILSRTGMKFSPRQTQGAHKWVDIHRWHEPARAYATFKERGYQIAATCFEEAVSLDEYDFSRPTAVVFGNEKSGVSPEAMEYADVRIRIPMYGFTSSFNVSVAAAIVLYQARRRLDEAGNRRPLPDGVMARLRDHFYWLSSSLSR